MNARDMGIDVMASVCLSAIGFAVVAGGTILAFALAYRLVGLAFKPRQVDSVERLEREKYAAYNEGFDAAAAGKIRKPPKDWDVYRR